VEILREVAALLCNLSLSEPERLELATFCVPALVDLAKSSDLEVARQSVGALANLSEDTKTHPVIGNSGGGRVMISLMQHDAIDIFREASRTIANLLSSFEHQATVIEDGLSGLVALGMSPDPECQYHAAMSFRKLGPNLRAHAGLFANHGLATLFFLIKVGGGGRNADGDEPSLVSSSMHTHMLSHWYGNPLPNPEPIQIQSQSQMFGT
jgi:hypothetical protein